MSESNPAEKANEYAIEALKQIITLSSAILALTITFIKDALGDARSQAVVTFLIPLSWTFLVISLWLAWVAIAEVAKTIGALKSNAIVYVLDPNIDKAQNIDDKTKTDIKWTRGWAKLSQVFFQLGIVFLTLFAIINFNLFFSPIVSSTNQSSQPTLTVTVAPTSTQKVLPTATPLSLQTPTP